MRLPRGQEDYSIEQNHKYPILFEETYWRLSRVEDSHDHSKVWSFISHLCPNRESPVDWMWSRTNRGQACPECDQFPSDELMALYKLHNWDRLVGVK